MSVLLLLLLMSKLFLLTPQQMAKIAPFSPLSHGVPRVDDRRVISGIIYVIRYGLRWKDAPKAYGPHKLSRSTERPVARVVSLTPWKQCCASTFYSNGMP